MGGLCIGGLLARDGRRVLLLEAGERPGGYAQRIEVGPATFCAQVQYVFDCGETEIVDRLLHALGLQDQIQWLRLDPEGFDVVSLAGERYRFPNGHCKHRERLIRKFPEHEAPLRSYFELLVDTRDEVLQLPARLRVTDLVTAPFFYPHALRYSTWTLQDVFDHLGMPPKLQAILAGQCGDYFLPPERVSFLMHASVTSAYDRGAYYPRRHFHDFIQRLAGVVHESPEGEVRYGHEVTEILQEEGRAVGVRTQDGSTFRASRIFSNLDPRRTAELAGAPPDEVSDSWRADYEYSASPFNLYLVLQGFDLRDHGFGNFNLWHYPEADLNAVYRRQLADGDLSRPWFFVSSPTLMSPEPGLAPAGHQTLHLVTSASYEHFAALREQGPEVHDAEVERVRRALLQTLEETYLPGLSRHILAQLVRSPLDNAGLVRAPRGNAYGAALTPANVNANRAPRRSPLEQLYLINATAGYPGVAGMATMAMQLHRQLED